MTKKNHVELPLVLDRALGPWNNVGTKLLGHPVNISYSICDGDVFLLVGRKSSMLPDKQSSWDYSLPSVVEQVLLCFCFVFSGR